MRKGKRVAGEALDKQARVKKQKKNVALQQAVEKRKSETKAQNKSYKEEEKGSEEEQMNLKGVVTDKNGPAAAPKKKIESKDDPDSKENKNSDEEELTIAKNGTATVLGTKQETDSEDEISSELEDSSSEEDLQDMPAKETPEMVPTMMFNKETKDSSCERESDEVEEKSINTAKTDNSNKEISVDEPLITEPIEKQTTQILTKTRSSVESSSARKEVDSPSDGKEGSSKSPQQKETNVEMVDAPLIEVEEAGKKAPQTSHSLQVQETGSKTLFVGNLSYSVERADVDNFFKEAGEIVDVHFALLPNGKFKGYGHVEFATADAALKALELNGKKLLGRDVKLDFTRERGEYPPSSCKEGDLYQKAGKAVTAYVRGFDKNDDEDRPQTSHSLQVQETGSKTLFVGNLSYSVERADVDNFFKEAGEIVDVRFASFPNGKFKGYGHVEFATAEAALKALELNGKKLLGRELKLDLARERGVHHPSSGKEGDSYQKAGKPQGITAYVRGFDRNDDENKIKNALKDHFSSCGEISRISILKESDSYSRGVAFLDFLDRDSLGKALELNNSKYGDSCLRVEEAKPRRGARDDAGGEWRGGSRFGGRHYSDRSR